MSSKFGWIVDFTSENVLRCDDASVHVCVCVCVSCAYVRRDHAQQRNAFIML